jgi:hypothetical protein
MAKNKIGKEKVLQLIKEEAFIITRKQELYNEIKKIEEELKHLNECMGLAGQGLTGTFGFKTNPMDGSHKSASGFVNPMSISHIEQLAKDMGMESPYENNSTSGYGDEFSPKDETDSQNLKNENELLKKELGELKALLGNKQ